MTGNTGSETTLRDVYQTLFRHKGKATLFFLTAVGTAVFLTIFLPPTYRSEAILFVRLGRENATLDPTATLGQTSIVAIPSSREDEINSVVEILRSRGLIEKVVDSIGPEAVLERGGDYVAVDQPQQVAMRPLDHSGAAGASDATGGMDRLEGSLVGASVTHRERATTKLSRELDVQRVRKSNVISITHESGSPQLARATVARLTDLFLQEYVRLHRTRGAHEFFDEQTQRLRTELAEAQQELSDVKSKTGLAAPEKQRGLLIDQIGRIEDELLRASQESSATETRVRRWKEQLPALPEHRLTSETAGQGNEGTDLMRQQFYALQLREQEMLAKYTDEHPKLKEIRKQAAAARDILGREEFTRKQTTTGPNRAFEEVEINLLRDESALAALQSRTEALRGQLAQMQDRMKKLNESELRIARLQREVELRDGSYRKYSASLEQSRIDRALEDERMSNISVVQPATLEMKPVRPRKLMNVLLGVVVGLCGGIGLALTAEYVDRSFRSPEDIEKKLDLPALVTIPRLSRRQLARNGKGGKHGH
jgi:uncharacterized protein involved in exopolysaccharide biosynthesis